MYVWTRKEAAEALEVSNGTISYWTKVWGPETDHPFPEPVAILALPRGRHQEVFDPGSVQVWFSDLPAAKHRRMSKAQSGAPRSRRPTAAWGTSLLDVSITELEESMALLIETIADAKALREQVQRG